MPNVHNAVVRNFEKQNYKENWQKKHWVLVFNKAVVAISYH